MGTLIVTHLRRFRLPMFARDLSRYERALPDTLYRHFVATPNASTSTTTTSSPSADRRAENPALLAADYDSIDVPILWWHNAGLRFTFA